MKIRIECKGADILPLDAIEEFQGNLKKRTQKDIDKIIKSIDKFGFSFPFFIWCDNGRNRCLDGHGRIEALKKISQKGVDLPLFPVIYVDAKDEEEARQKLLRLNSQYGQMTLASVMEFANGMELCSEELSLGNGEMIELEYVEKGNEEKDDDITYHEKHEIIITAQDDEDCEQLYNEFTERGLKCRVSTL